MVDRQTVSEFEERLRQAMLTSDLDSLDTLIAEDLLFTTQTGAVVGKAEDLDAHRSGALQLTALDPSDSHILTFETSAVVSVRMDVVGVYEDEPFAGTYRYTRVWGRANDTWQVVAGHMSPIDSAPSAA